MAELTLETPALKGTVITGDIDVLKGVHVIAMGKARGHDLMIDETTLDQVIDLGNASPQGVKCRANHPNICSPGFGTALGRFKDFRRSGDVVVADLHWSDAAPKTAKDHILSVAKSDPGLLGASVSISTVESERVEDEDKVSYRLCRVDALHAVDIVDDPAATDGLFGELPKGVNLDSRTMVDLKKALTDPGFVTHAQGVLSHQAKLLGMANTSELEPADPATEKDRVAYIVKFSRGKAHLQEVALEAIASGCQVVNFLEQVIERSDKEFERINKLHQMELLEATSAAIDIKNVEPMGGEFSQGGETLKESFLRRFLSQGYSEEQAQKMAEEAAHTGD